MNMEDQIHDTIMIFNVILEIKYSMFIYNFAI